MTRPSVRLEQKHSNHTTVPPPSVQQTIKQISLPVPVFFHQATISYYQLMHMHTVALPVHYQTLCESSKLYDPGQQYAAHVRDLQLPEQPNVLYTFENYCASSSSQ